MSLSGRKAEVIAAVGLCLAYVFLAVIHAGSTSATFDEPTHLASGYSYWRWHDYRLNPEHPPLVKRLASLPLLAMDPFPGAYAPTGPPLEDGASLNWRRASRVWDQAPDTPDAQWVFGHAMLYGMTDDAVTRNGVDDSYEVVTTAELSASDFVNDADRLLFTGRLPVIGLGLALGILIYIWTRRLYGPAGALLALALYSFDPNFIAHGSLVTTDVGAALAFAAVMFTCWWFLQNPAAPALSAFCVAIGFAAATKYSAILLAPMILLLCILARPARRPVVVGLLLTVAALSATTAIWASYGFRYRATVAEANVLPTEQTLRRAVATARMREKYPDVAPPASELAAAERSARLGIPERLVMFARDFELLPEAYLHGLAHTRLKSAGRYSFLRGEYAAHGRPSYFFWTFLLKTPLATLVVIGVAVSLAIARRRVGREVPFLALPVVAYLLVLAGSSLNIGHRHLLPIYPFLFVFCGSLALHRRSRAGVAALIGTVALSASVVFAPPWRPTLVYPHYLAFFNELAGGPAEGYRSLVDSNLDWGQDLIGLRQWLDEHGVEEPINLCYFGTADPRYHGIRHVKMPGGYRFSPPFGNRAAFEDARLPGLLAISATNVQGVYFSPELRQMWRTLLARSRRVGHVGHSIFIYEVGGGEP